MRKALRPKKKLNFGEILHENDSEYKKGEKREPTGLLQRENEAQMGTDERIIRERPQCVCDFPFNQIINFFIRKTKVRKKADA